MWLIPVSNLLAVRDGNRIHVDVIRVNTDLSLTPFAIDPSQMSLVEITGFSHMTTSEAIHAEAIRQC